MTNCVFCDIRDGKIAKEFVYEDEDIMVFPDIHPIRPTHLLIVPKEHIKDFADFTKDELLLKTNKIIRKMITENNLTNKGYRIGVNGGGAQIIEHLHFHLISPWGKNE